MSEIRTHGISFDRLDGDHRHLRALAERLARAVDRCRRCR
jgi:hypothetical protein